MTVRAPASPVVEPDREEAGHFGRLVAGMVAEAVMVAAREEAGRSHPLVAELVAEAVILAARAAQADRAPADLVAASDAVAAAARRTAGAARRLYEARAQAAEEAAEAIADHALGTTSDPKVRADAATRELTHGALEAAALILAARDQVPRTVKQRRRHWPSPCRSATWPLRARRPKWRPRCRSRPPRGLAMWPGRRILGRVRRPTRRPLVRAKVSACARGVRRRTAPARDHEPGDHRAVRDRGPRPVV